MKGYVHIYRGDGKGKTTAAIGLVIRTAGRGKRVVMARSLKTEDSGEVEAPRSILDTIVLPCEKASGFYFQVTEEQKREAALCYESLLGQAWSMTVETRTDMMMLDEITVSYSCHLVEEK